MHPGIHTLMRMSIYTLMRQASCKEIQNQQSYILPFVFVLALALVLVLRLGLHLVLVLRLGLQLVLGF